MIREIKENNTTAFEVFLDSHQELVYFYFLKKTKSTADAQDLTQQTFIKFWEYRSSLHEEIPPKTQLFHKAKLVFIDWLRKQATLYKLHEQLLQEEQQRQIPEHDTDEALHEKLRRNIDLLPEKRRQVLLLFQYKGYSYQQISTLLNISPKTVDNHMYQAMKQLRRMMMVFPILIIFRPFY